MGGVSAGVKSGVLNVLSGWLEVSEVRVVDMGFHGEAMGLPVKGMVIGGCY